MSTLKKGFTVSGMVSVLCAFVGIFIYKFLVHGRREALLFTPLIGLWLLATLLVIWVSKRNRNLRA